MNALATLALTAIGLVIAFYLASMALVALVYVGALVLGLAIWAAVPFVWLFVRLVRWLNYHNRLSNMAETVAKRWSTITKRAEAPLWP